MTVYSEMFVIVKNKVWGILISVNKEAYVTESMWELLRKTA
jgi:hypothetical protein